MSQTAKLGYYIEGADDDANQLVTRMNQMEDEIRAKLDRPAKAMIKQFQVTVAPDFTSISRELNDITQDEVSKVWSKSENNIPPIQKFP